MVQRDERERCLRHIDHAYRTVPRPGDVDTEVVAGCQPLGFGVGEFLKDAHFPGSECVQLFGDQPHQRFFRHGDIGNVDVVAPVKERPHPMMNKLGRQVTGEDPRFEYMGRSAGEVQIQFNFCNGDTEVAHNAPENKGHEGKGCNSCGHDCVHCFGESFHNLHFLESKIAGGSMSLRFAL